MTDGFGLAGLEAVFFSFVVEVVSVRWGNVGVFSSKIIYSVRSQQSGWSESNPEGLTGSLLLLPRRPAPLLIAWNDADLLSLRSSPLFLHSL